MLSRLAIPWLLFGVMWAQADNLKKPSPIHYKSATVPTLSKTRAEVGREPSANPAIATDEEGIACYGADTLQLTAATSRYPIGSRVRVTNLATGKSVVVTITGRSEIQGRIINVSRLAADQLGFLREGTTRVRLARLKEQPVSTD